MALRAASQEVPCVACLQERVLAFSGLKERHAGILFPPRNLAREKRIRDAFKAIEVRRRAILAMHRLFVRSQELFADWDPRDKLMSRGGDNYFNNSSFWSSWVVRYFADGFLRLPWGKERRGFFDELCREIFDQELIDSTDLIERELEAPRTILSRVHSAAKSAVGLLRRMGRLEVWWGRGQGSEEGARRAGQWLAEIQAEMDAEDEEEEEELRQETLHFDRKQYVVTRDDRGAIKGITNRVVRAEEEGANRPWAILAARCERAG